MTGIHKKPCILLFFLIISMTWLQAPPCFGDKPMFPIPLMLPVPDGVWRTVDPGGSGGTLDFVMHPADGTLLASSDMGRSLLRCTDWQNGFEPVAPPGHPTLDVLVPHPRQQGTWYAGFDSPDGRGLFKSRDNGGTWNLVHSSSAIARNTAYALVIDTGAGDTLIWGIKNQGLVISRDSGKQFADFSKGLDVKNLYGFSKNLSARNLILAAETNNQTLVFLASGTGLFQRSLHPDAADQAWKKIPDLPAEPITCLAHDRVKKWIWAATRSGKLFKNDLVSGKWDQVPYTTASPAPPDITLLQTHPKKPGHLWCFSHGRAGLFHSSDQGKTWQWLTRNFLTDTETYQGNVPKDFRHKHKFTRDYFFIHPGNPDHLILGDMYQSMDGGNTWQFFAARYLPDRHAWQGKGLTLLTAYRAFWDQTNPNRVYLGFSDTGLMRTDDRGFSVTSLWSSQYPDLSPLAYWSTQMLDTSGSCMAFAADPEFATTQFYGMSGKGGKNSANGMLFTTTTDGRHWEPVFPEQSGLPGGMITDLVIMDGNGYGRRTLYAVTNTLDRDRPVSGIYFSKDSGRTFERLADNLTSPLGFPLMNLEACRDHPDVLYAAAGSEGGKRPARQLQKSLDTPLPDGGVFRSDDAGHTWIRTGGPELAGAVQVAVHPHDPDIAYAAVVPGRGKSNAEAHVKRGGILKTLDGGRTWNHVLDFSSPVPGLGVIDAGAPTSVAINPVLPDIVYAAVDRAGVFRTMDSGTTWHRVDWDRLKRFQATYHTLSINPHDPAEFYLALFGNAFLAYRDPDTAKALARSAGHLPLVPNGDFEQIRNNGTPVHWTWNNLDHPGPDGSPILTIAPAPDRKGNALQANMSAATYQNPAFTGGNQGPITFLSTRMPPWAMSQVRGKTIEISYDIHATRLKGPDLPILSLVETVGPNRKMIAELPAVLAYTRTPYEKADIKKGHPLAGKWMTVTTTTSVSPRANALKLVLHTTAENKKTMLYIDNITITIADKAHGR
jgi:photosystem II stability/assembly factor-like uncharacterized protein